MHKEEASLQEVNASPAVVEGNESGQVDTAEEAVRYVYTCRMCGHPLFKDAELVPHDSDRQGKGNKPFKSKWNGMEQREGVCTSYFLDPDVTEWVSADCREASDAGLEVLPDTLYCPNLRCHAKLGTQSWTGLQCSCGAWVTPAFKVLGRAVDRRPEKV